MRKPLLVLIGLLLLIGTIGCGSGSGGSGNQGGGSEAPAGGGKKQTISWWVPNWDEETARKLVAKFESENPDIKVDIVVTTWDTMENKIRVALMASDAPEVITDLESRVKDYAAKNLLAKLDDYVERDLDKSDIIPSALDINTYDGSLYGIPFRHDGSGILYNKGMFEKAGLDPDRFPETWDEFIKAAEKLTVDTDGDGKIDQYGMAWPLGNQANAITRFMQLLFTEGGSFFDETGKKAVLNSPEAVEAMRKLTATVIDGTAPKSTMEVDNTGVRDLFVNEKVAMYIGGQFDIEPIRKAKPSIELGTAVLPGPDGMGTTTVDGFSFIMPQTAGKKDLGWRLIQFLSEPENMGELTATFPGRKSALTLPKFSDPLLQPFAKQLDKGETKPVADRWTDIEKILYRNMQLIILEQKDVQATMDQANREIDALLK
ncbi:hypothetical protein PAE9249_02786 [Paenibacillus sp. CECT 9249]|uniref:ABC transporter substrate-binding protein n=1 Tax=Paenibacillus sp. CECT 9249 TaxID=2845385 RepID=UPI001E3F3060|nr:ABC transporter substrate-binding protein [Paenibacillus sp. CECT 9249]CAH0120269.1 hypothetical protein PAE9249_02786 [Paenibacillus sp. CECT 9249]